MWENGFDHFMLMSRIILPVFNRNTINWAARLIELHRLIQLKQIKISGIILFELKYQWPCWPQSQTSKIQNMLKPLHLIELLTLNQTTYLLHYICMQTSGLLFKFHLSNNKSWLRFWFPILNIEGNATKRVRTRKSNILIFFKNIPYLNVNSTIQPQVSRVSLNSSGVTVGPRRWNLWKQCPT